MAQIAEAQTIDVMLSNHLGYDGTATVLRSLPVMSVCVQAQRDRFVIGHEGRSQASQRMVGHFGQ